MDTIDNLMKNIDNLLRDDKKAKEAERMKAYRATNREKINEDRRKWREANKDKEKERNMKYRESHIEHERQRHKQYVEAHKEEIQAYNKAYKEQEYKCEVCNSVMRLGSKSAHRKSIKHTILSKPIGMKIMKNGQTYMIVAEEGDYFQVEWHDDEEERTFRLNMLKAYVVQDAHVVQE